MAVNRDVCVFAIWILMSSCVTYAHIPMRYFEWAEPNAPVYATDPATTSITKQQTLDRLTALRALMSTQGVDAYIIPTADAHNSQYIAPCDARREWISGFTGSAGIAVVTSTRGLIWTDGRYFAQFYLEVNTTHWDLMRQGTDLSIQAWLIENLPRDSVVGIDPTTYTRNSWTSLQNALLPSSITLLPVSTNLVDIARENINDPAPPRPNEPLTTLILNFTGKPASEKINELLSQMSTRGASALVLTALDDIAYTLNLRGSDIPYNPVFFAYLVITSDMVAGESLYLFWGNGTQPMDVFLHLQNEGVNLFFNPYEDIYDYLRNTQNMTHLPEIPDGSTIWLSQDASHAIHLAAENNGTRSIISSVSPIALMKCVKNAVELQGFRSAHIKDGIAVVRALRWVHQLVDSGETVTEVMLSDKLVEFRTLEQEFVGPSFETIAGAGENGAIIHYKPSRDGPQRNITANDMLLVDSGAQYRDGTTDITRTRHMSGNLTTAQRNAFTRVIKGQILLGTAVFPKGITGNILETLARKSLWDVGLNYAHGTGHGVGHFLNVHEGPSGIGSTLSATDPGIMPGMIFSNEPGYYENDQYGIRHEDLVQVIELNRDSDHIYAEGLFGDFNGVGALGFYTISLAPHQIASLDLHILNDDELRYLNNYHARVLSTLGPILLERNLTEDYEWLQRECAPIHRSAAMFVKSAPILILISVVSLWFGA